MKCVFELRMVRGHRANGNPVGEITGERMHVRIDARSSHKNKQDQQG